jgi:hypothetical protein
MNTGVIILANNSSKVNYLKLATISASCAKKNLKVPVSLITDNQTLDRITRKEKEYLNRLFDKIILEDLPPTDNLRRLNFDGVSETIDFLNSHRFRSFELSPYDRTLLIDSDFLIFSNNFTRYWDVDQSVMISPYMVNLDKDKGPIADTMVSPQSIPLYWATTVMFTKNEEAESFFNLVDHVRQNYQFYSQLYQFSVNQYRNDISFSIAYHIMRGFNSTPDYFLPPLMTFSQFDQFQEIQDNAVKIYVFNQLTNSHDRIVSLKNTDIHFMNKMHLIYKSESFL